VKRRLFNAGAVVSLVVCLSTVTLWVRSYWYSDQLWRDDLDEIGTWGTGQTMLHSDFGQLSAQWVSPPPGASKGWYFYSSPRQPSRWDRPLSHLFDFSIVNSWAQISETELAHHIYFPHWWLVAASAALPSWWFVGLLRARQKSHACPACGYDLRGTPGSKTCPECGAALEAKAGRV
jgi:hypothetical protein